MPNLAVPNVPFVEETAQFSCSGDTLYGVLARPQKSVHTARTGVVVIVGGPQTRVGSHRQFVLLSRALAAAGIPVLRFDYRGMGDSEGEARNFQAVSQDIRQAIDSLQSRVPKAKQVVLWGLCDGASAALLYCHETGDVRVTGLYLVNPWVRSEVSLAKTHIKHYYVDRFRQKEFWLKLARGGVAWSALAELLRNLWRAVGGRGSIGTPDAALTYQDRMAKAWLRFAGPILLYISGSDYTAKEFLSHAAANSQWQGALTKPGVKLHVEASADHTVSGNREHQALIGTSIDLVSGIADSGNTHAAP